jgi:hypothetical protein
MIFQYRHLHQNPSLFRAMTGLTVAEFDDYIEPLCTELATANRQRLEKRKRQRAVGGGADYELDWRDQLLLTIIWLRRFPTYEVLGYYFGCSDSSAWRTVQRVLPVLEASGDERMRQERDRRGRGYRLEELLSQTPELAVIVDTFEQRVQRPSQRQEADQYYSGKKKQHTLKSQIAVDAYTGCLVAVSDSVYGPTADIDLLEQSALLTTLPPATPVLGDLAYVGIDKLHPTGQAFRPRRKPRSQPRPAQDIIFNTWFARCRVLVEHTIARLRHYAALRETDRLHRRQHRERIIAVAGLVNFQKRCRFVY